MLDNMSGRLQGRCFVTTATLFIFRNFHYLFQLDWRLWLQTNISSLRHVVFCVLCRQFWVWTRNTWSDTSVCWDLRQMLWKCLWIRPHFSYGQGKENSCEYGNRILNIKAWAYNGNKRTTPSLFILGSFYIEWAGYGRNGTWN